MKMNLIFNRIEKLLTFLLPIVCGGDDQDEEILVDVWWADQGFAPAFFVRIGEVDVIHEPGDALNGVFSCFE